IHEPKTLIARGSTNGGLPAEVKRLSLKQLRRKLVEILPPLVPRVRAVGLVVNHVELVLLEHLDGSSRGLDEKIVLAGRKPEVLQPLLQLRIIEDGLVLLLEARTLRLTARSAAGNPEDARAVNTEI